MRAFSYLITYYGLASLAHALAVDGTCPSTGTPGAVTICATTPGWDSTHHVENCHWFSKSECTQFQKALDIIPTVFGSGMARTSFVHQISPDRGGHCLFYHSDDCADGAAMPLNNPFRYPLGYPNKVICPGIVSPMLPQDWTATKCFPHGPDE